VKSFWAAFFSSVRDVLGGATNLGGQFFAHRCTVLWCADFFWGHFAEDAVFYFYDVSLSSVSLSLSNLFCYVF